MATQPLRDTTSALLDKFHRYKIMLSDGTELGAGDFAGGHAPVRIVGSGQGMVVDIDPGAASPNWTGDTACEIVGYPVGKGLGRARLSMSKENKLHWEVDFSSWQMQGIYLDIWRVGLYALDKDKQPIGLRVRPDPAQKVGDVEQLGVFASNYKVALGLDCAFVPVTNVLAAPTAGNSAETEGKTVT